MKRVEPVDGDAAADHVEVGGPIAQRRGAVRRVDGAARADLAGPIGEWYADLELLPHEGVARLFRRREMRPGAGDLDAIVCRAHASQLDQRVRITLAKAAHAAVELEVNPGPPPELRRGPRAGLAKALPPDRDVRAGGERLAQLVLGECAHHENRRLGEVQAKLLRLGGGRHREPGGATAKGCRGADGGPVPVAVRLHDRAELCALANPVLERAAVPLHRAGIDQRRRPACRLRTQIDSPAGIDSMTSPAITESWPTRSPAARPARECATTAAQ